MPPPPNKRPPPPAAAAKEPVDDTDPGAPIDMRQTGQMRLKPARRPAPQPSELPAAPAAIDDEQTPPSAAPGERTLIYDQNKGRALGTGAKLIITAGPRAGSEVPLGEAGETSIGRGSESTIVIPDISVSRRHAVLRKESKGWVVLDQGSGNGTRVNGLVVGRHELGSGDVIELGDSSLQFVEAGGVAVKSGVRTAAPAAETQSPPKAAIRAGGPRATPAFASIIDDRPEHTNPRGTGLQKRTPLYLAVGLALCLAVAAGWYRQHVREKSESDAAQNTGSKAAAQSHFAEAVELVKAGQWALARDKLAVAASLDESDEEIRRYLERAKIEAPRAQAVAAAKESLSRRNYKAARDALRAVPEDSALYDKAGEILQSVRTQMELAVQDAKGKAETGDTSTAEALLAPVLEAEPDRREALAVRDLLRAGRRPAAAREEADEPAEPKAAAAAATPQAPPPDAAAVSLAPAVDTYLAGDVGSAITRAESLGVTNAGAAKLARELRDLDAGYREGLAKADAKKPTEALRALEAADQLDKKIAQGKPSKIGKELRKTLSRVHYQLGAGSMGSDDGLPQAAVHLRAAVLADPGNDLARQQLEQVVARAQEIYLRGYVAKENDGETARQLFKLVIEILPAGDGTSEKAKRWIEKLDGKAPKEDG